MEIEKYIETSLQNGSGVAKSIARQCFFHHGLGARFTPPMHTDIEVVTIVTVVVGSPIAR